MADIATATTRPQNNGMAVLALGFRPFYLLAGLFAILAIPIWVAEFAGLVQHHGHPIGVGWHSHEMIFGFATAVIAGFLLTAVRNWTDRPTPIGRRLAALALVWVSGRVLAFTGPALPAAIVDLAFLPVLAIVIATPILQSRSTRNYKILIVLAGLTATNALFHLATLGALPASTTRIATTAALDVIAVLIAIMAGRVIPAFTATAVPSARPRRLPFLEFAAIGSLLLMLALDVLEPWYTLSSVALAALFFIAALTHAVRLLLWDPHRTYRNALLLMLPVAYAWIPIMLALRGFAALNLAPATAATHGLALGATAGLMLAMMMRSALGHTGRSLAAGHMEIAAFVLIQAAAIARVAAVVVAPAHYRALVVLSGSLWVLAFAVFLFRYWPMLTRPRLDGRPG